jgi:Undecaprenyl-phosphate galactose phosphotransferase WbaP
MIAEAVTQRSIVIPKRTNSIKSTFMCLIASDVLTLIASVTLSLLCKTLTGGAPVWQSYIRLWPFLLVFVAVYGLVGLYSGVALSPPVEIRRVTISSALVFLILSATTIDFRGASRYVTGTLFLAMGISIALLPLMRSIVRRKCSNKPWWGSPAVIFGAGPEGRRIVSTLLEQPELGLKPVAVVDDEARGVRFIRGIPVISGFELRGRGETECRWAYAVVVMPNLPSSRFLEMVKEHRLHFSHVLMIPNLTDFGSSLWVDPKNVGGMLGLEVCQQAFVRTKQWPKRVLDLILTIVGGIAILPLVGLIAVAVKMDSPGPALYKHERIGQDGKTFWAWKFRSMVSNADEILGRYLDENPDLRIEWEESHKLKHDPRITRTGRFLRRTSLDELPQLWNVLKGEMSLVGPRPIVEAEIPKYGQKFGLYTKVKSGLTGLWQISGRSDTSYEDRVRLDSFYVSNWSVWLDLYILVRTIETVVFRQGAY